MRSGRRPIGNPGLSGLHHVELRREHEAYAEAMPQNRGLWYVHISVYVDIEQLF